MLKRIFYADLLRRTILILFRLIKMVDIPMDTNISELHESTDIKT